MHRDSLVSSSNAPAIDDDIPIKNEVSAGTPVPSSNASGSRSPSIQSKDIQSPENARSPSPDVSSLNRSHNDSGLSRTLSQHNCQPHNSDQNEILFNQSPALKSPSTSLEIDMSPSNGSVAPQRDEFSREKLLKINGSTVRSLEDVDIQIEDEGCCNPSFTKSETVAIAPLNDDERTVKKSNSMKLKRGYSDPNIQTVL